MSDLNIKVGVQLESGIEAKLQAQLNQTKLNIRINDIILNDQIVGKIQNSLNQAKINFNINPQVNPQNIIQQGQNIGTQLQNTINNSLGRLDFSKIKGINISRNTSGLIDIEKTLQSAQAQLSKFGNVKFNWSIDKQTNQLKSFVATITDANGTVQKLNFALNGTPNIATKFNPTSINGFEKSIGNSAKEVSELNKALKQAEKSTALAFKKENLQSNIDQFLSANTRMGEELRLKFLAIREAANSVSSNNGLTILRTQLSTLKNEAKALGQVGKTFSDSLRGALSGVTTWISATTIFFRTIQTIKSGFNTVKELDTSLIDLKKTTTMTSSQLNEFYYSANNVAKQMGVSTNEIIKQAAAWSRLGYSTSEAATQMAKYSSMFATISPGMDLERSTDGLVSVMKAFKIETDDVVDGIMSKINTIGNNKALNNSDIVDFLTRSSSAMAEANNSLDETIALGEAAVEITRDAASVGNMLKTVSMRIRGYDEETEQYIGGIEQLSGSIADLTKTASTPGGISLFTDDSKETYKSTYQLLEEISKIYDELSDKSQANDICLCT